MTADIIEMLDNQTVKELTGKDHNKSELNKKQ